MRVPLVFHVDEVLLPHSSTSLKLRDARRGILDYVAQSEDGTVFLTDLEGKAGTLSRIVRLQPQGEEGVYVGSVLGIERGLLTRRFVSDEYRIEFGDIQTFPEPSEEDRVAAADFLRWLDPALLQLPDGLAEIGLAALRLRDVTEPVAYLYRVASLFLRSSPARKEFLLLTDVGEQVGYLLQVIRRACLTGELSGWTPKPVGAERVPH
jgi:hypothetical protein